MINSSNEGKTKKLSKPLKFNGKEYWTVQECEDAMKEAQKEYGTFPTDTKINRLGAENAIKYAMKKGTLKLDDIEYLYGTKLVPTHSKKPLKRNESFLWKVDSVCDFQKLNDSKKVETLVHYMLKYKKHGTFIQTKTAKKLKSINKIIGYRDTDNFRVAEFIKHGDIEIISRE